MHIWLAPLHGITYASFRNLFFKYFGGFDYAITPFFPAQEQKMLNVAKWKDLFPENNPNVEIIPQLMGNNPQSFVDTIHTLQNEYGYKRFNWNIGCPANQIVRKKRGCGIMPYPEEIQNVVDAVLAQCNCQFSIKMRSGFQSSEEALQVIAKLNAYPLDFIVVHPRLGCNHYDGAVDLLSFEKIVRASANKIIYSGDITSFTVFKDLSFYFPMISEWMLGRGFLQNPFLAQEIKAQTQIHYGITQKQIFGNFYTELMEIYKKEKGERRTLANLKELWHYFSYFTYISEEEINRILRVEDLSEFYEKTFTILTSSFNPANR